MGEGNPQRMTSFLTEHPLRAIRQLFDDRAIRV